MTFTFTHHDRETAEGKVESLKARLSSWAMLEEGGEDRHSEIVRDRRELEKAQTWLAYVNQQLSN